MKKSRRALSAKMRVHSLYADAGRPHSDIEHPGRSQRFGHFGKVLVLSAAVLGLGLACAVETPGARENLSVAEGVPNIIPQPSQIGFVIDKWLDAAGTQTAPVDGSFANFSVQLHQPLDLQALVGATATVSVDLTSLDTEMPIRDTNIEEAYFQTQVFTTASVDLVITSSSPLADGSVQATADASLTLHGILAPVGSVQLLFTRSAGGVRVKTLAPVPVTSSGFGMPVAALLERCGHLGIGAQALVSADLALGNSTP